MAKNPQIVVIGGPNGAGKSTIAREILTATQVDQFVNADAIASGLSAARPETVAFQSGRIMLARLHELATLRKNFAFETTLSARSYARWIRGLCAEGWFFRLFFVTLQNVDLAIERVKERVAGGGHDIPEEDIRRRFFRSHANFRDFYAPLAAFWTVYDNSSNTGPRRIAFGHGRQNPNIIEEDLWKQFCEVGNAG